MAYDILQLNDMLVPELIDIAESLGVPDAKKTDKQNLIYRILDKQAIIASGDASHTDDEQPKKRRGRKPKEENEAEAPPPLLNRPLKQNSRKNHKG